MIHVPALENMHCLWCQVLENLHCLWLQVSSAWVVPPSQTVRAYARTGLRLRHVVAYFRNLRLSKIREFPVLLSEVALDTLLYSTTDAVKMMASIPPQ